MKWNKSDKTTRIVCYFESWIDKTVKELTDLYSSSLDEDKKRLQKQLIFEQLKQRYQQNQSQFQFLNYGGWFAQI